MTWNVLFCKEERNKRILVANARLDHNFDSEKFEIAPAVFPNNDVKYEVNKLRAHGYATHRGHVIMYCPAIETRNVCWCD